MDRVTEFLNVVRDRRQAQGEFLGLLHVLIGRRITLADGTPVCDGLTWRQLAALLKKLRWETEVVAELGLNPADLPPRDRQRFWYSAIAQAHVDSPKACTAGDRLAQRLKKSGYIIGPAPGG